MNLRPLLVWVSHTPSKSLAFNCGEGGDCGALRVELPRALGGLVYVRGRLLLETVANHVDVSEEHHQEKDHPHNPYEISTTEAVLIPLILTKILKVRHDLIIKKKGEAWHLSVLFFNRFPKNRLKFPPNRLK